MILMAVESSCDETAVALVEDGRRVLTDCIASQVDLHRIYGGVVPEIASRKHIEAIYGLADQALVRAGLKRKDVDGIAVTYAPGLIGAVLVGVNFAKGATSGATSPPTTWPTRSWSPPSSAWWSPAGTPCWFMSGTIRTWRFWVPPWTTPPGSALTR